MSSPGRPAQRRQVDLSGRPSRPPRPKIADYPFTTLTPNLGVVDLSGNERFVMADVPGLIEGASEGAGLGVRFLGHLERTAVLIHLIDATGEDPVGAWRAIRTELEAYAEGLEDKSEIVALNKIDALDPAATQRSAAKMKEGGRPPYGFHAGLGGVRRGGEAAAAGGLAPRSLSTAGRRRRRPGWRKTCDAVNMLAAARLIVVKVGSALVARAGSGEVDHAWLAAFASDAARLKGARGQGPDRGVLRRGGRDRRRLGMSGRVLSLAEKQAAAAAGQSLLMAAWQEAMAPHNIHVAQLLLTADDTEARRRFLNARATLSTLIELGVLPVVNENDTVATEELRYGDNDRLAARVAQMAGADVLVLLSDVDGLYTADPRRSSDARRLERVEAITPEIEAMAGGANRQSAVGSGGMVTKLAAARIAAAAGCATVVTLGHRPAPLLALEEGAAATFFAPHSTPAAAYKAWIAGSLAPHGVLVVDDGAAAALRAGKSLLAAGVTSAQGRFGKGDAVVVRDLAGRDIGRGLARYDATDARRIAGLRSSDIETLLGEAAAPLIHADDLALGASAERPG